MRLLSRLRRRTKPGQPLRSADYWQARYAQGGNSGSGSYGRLADYKAQVINALVETRKISSVIEFGSGDGNQCSLLTVPNYTGVDISAQVVQACRTRFADRKGWVFLTDEEYRAAPVRAELAMSLDVIYHLIEDSVFETYMRTLTAASTRFVLIYSSDHDAGTNAEHVRHRAYSDWMRQHAPDFALVESLAQPFPLLPGSDRRTTSFAAFKLFERMVGGPT